MHRHLLALSLGVAALAALGCETQAYCFDCPDGVSDETGGSRNTGGGIDPGTGGLVIPETGGGIDPGGAGSTGGAGGGSTDCDAELDSDALNCGTCGNVCQVPGAFPKCVGGQCRIDECAPGRYDIDGNQGNGCEYACEESNDGDEICDTVDNDCDGAIDEGFDLDTDPENCGSCGVSCSAVTQVDTVECAVPEGKNRARCSVVSCASTDTGGFADVDGIWSNGCEYTCPVWPITTEQCNDVDDNCDGRNNEGNPGGGAACCPFQDGDGDDLCGVGACGFGTTRCVGNGFVCEGGDGPSFEVCDDVLGTGDPEFDNDCDGLVDEGFDLDTDVNNCGACGNECEFDNAIARCDTGTCEFDPATGCLPGFGDEDGEQDNGCEYTCPVNPPTVELCNGVDDDCDGLVDAADPSLVIATSFCSQLGLCAGITPTCVDGEWECNYAAYDPDILLGPGGVLALVEEQCDGVDENCNGVADDAWPEKGEPCFVGVGKCAGEATYTCNGAGDDLECLASPQPTQARNELCNGIDDNCDGQIDERNPSGSLSCYDAGPGSPAPCQGYKDTMTQVTVSGVPVWVYRWEASRPDATAVSGGAATERACSKSGVQPWTSVTLDQAEAACAAIDDSLGNPMRLCTEDEWAHACGAEAGNAWAFAASPNTAPADGASVCVDDYRNPEPTGPLATGSAAQCYANAPNGALYDMSGNVAEWTSTLVTVQGDDYARVRGGNFRSWPEPATRCDFDFVLFPPDFANFDLGFRCCSDAAP